MSIPTRLHTLLFLLAAILGPAPTYAQGTPLSQILPVLIGNTITLQPSNLPDQPTHVAHFQPGNDFPAQGCERALADRVVGRRELPDGAFRPFLPRGIQHLDAADHDAHELHGVWIDAHWNQAVGPRLRKEEQHAASQLPRERSSNA